MVSLLFSNFTFPVIIGTVSCVGWAPSSHPCFLWAGATRAVKRVLAKAAPLNYVSFQVSLHFLPLIMPLFSVNSKYEVCVVVTDDVGSWLHIAVDRISLYGPIHSGLSMYPTVQSEEIYRLLNQRNTYYRIEEIHITESEKYILQKQRNTWYRISLFGSIHRRLSISYYFVPYVSYRIHIVPYPCLPFLFVVCVKSMVRSAPNTQT